MDVKGMRCKECNTNKLKSFNFDIKESLEAKMIDEIRVANKEDDYHIPRPEDVSKGVCVKVNLYVDCRKCGEFSGKGKVCYSIRNKKCSNCNCCKVDVVSIDSIKNPQFRCSNCDKSRRSSLFKLEYLEN